MIALAANSIVRVLLAPACASCGESLAEPLAGPVCGRCWREVPKLVPPGCVRCGDSLREFRGDGPLCARCRRQPARLSIARSAGRYDGTLREIVHAFKYQGRRVLATPLAALLREAGGELLCVREDVGRHNAMDKVVGWAFGAGLMPLADKILCVSGRLSFELVQKAAVAGCPVVVAVGPPSTLAVELARDRGVTLCGFVRDGRVNVYSEPQRIG